MVDESSWCDLGAIESRHDPTSIFEMQHMARIEAQKAFVHLDTSKRVARALLKNASPIDIKYEVGDVVVFRKDNNVGSGKTSWSPASRVIGFEGKKNAWVLTRGVPVLISAGNLRPASQRCRSTGSTCAEWEAYTSKRDREWSTVIC